MMHLHMKRASEKPVFDLLAEAYRAGQAVYKTGLVTHLNSRRRALKKKPLEWPAVGATPHQVVWTEGSARLLRYDANASKSTGAPILLVCSLINRPYILDILEDRSVVRRLLEAGRDVWMLDWGTPTAEAAENGLGYYALELLPRAAAQVRATTGALAPHVLGYCMGGTLALMAIAAGKLTVASLVAMATPVDFHDQGLLSVWCRAPGFDPAEIVKVYGNAPAHLLQPAFKMLDPIGLSTKLAHLEDKVGDDDFVRFFLAMETWLEDSVAFPGQAFLEWVRLYQENALERGTLKLGGHAIDLSRVTCPIFSLVAERDYITPAASALALQRLAPRATHTVQQLAGGHIGLSTSSAAHRTLWPAVAVWLSAQELPSPVVKQSHKKTARKKARA
jgi:polyhydroxyalkanoate synthase subunit PhaC